MDRVTAYLPRSACGCNFCVNLLNAKYAPKKFQKFKA